MTGDEMEALRDWWDGLREVEQFAAYIAEKSNADGLASTRPIGVEEAIARCHQMLADERAAQARIALEAAFDRDAIDELAAAAQDVLDALNDPVSARYPRSIALDALSEAIRVSTNRVSTNRPSSRVLGLTLDEIRTAVATADQYHPQWRSLQNGHSSQGE